MTLASLLNDFMLLCIFMLAGFAIREVAKPIQKLYIPASVVGGAIALICGEQVLGLIILPESFRSMSGVFINIIMTSLLFGVTMNLKRARNYLDYSLMIMFTYGLQAGVGVALGLFLSGIWPDMPYGWGLMGIFTFWGGHGTAAAVGSIFSENGVPDNLGLGMILATIGLMVAILVGMVIVNWGIRKGYAGHLEGADGSKSPQLCGVIPKEKQRTLGHETIYSGSLNSAALQICLLLASLYIGNRIIEVCTSVIPAIKAIPMMTRGMIGALIIWPVMVKTKLDGYADKRTMETISGVCLEIIVFAAIATLRLDLVTKFMVPILIFSTVFTVMMIFCVLLFAKKMCREDWFEKAMLHFGQGTGAMSTGLALLRCVDPELKSTAAESVTMANTFTLPITSIGPVLLPLLIMTSPGGVMALGFGLAAVCLTLAFAFCYKK